MDIPDSYKTKFSKKRFIEALESWPSDVGAPLMLLSALMGEAFEWEKWDKLIPFIKWPDGWEIKARPAFNGAIIRYKVRRNDAKEFSIYLDCYNALGMFTGPYWEAYPIDGDTFRCGLKEVDKLVEAIKESK